MRGIFAVIILICCARPAVAATNACKAPNFTLQGSSCTVDTNYLSKDFGPVSLAGGVSAMVCGDTNQKNRVALAGDGTYLWTPLSSSMAPNTLNSFPGYDDGTGNGSDNQNYFFTANNISLSAPIYGFPAKARCYCMGTSTASGSRSFTPSVLSAAIPNPTPYSATLTGSVVSRVYPVTFDVINTQTQDASVSYGPVHIATTRAATGAYNDGREYSLFNGSGRSSYCGCPNFNEDADNSNASSSSPILINPCKPLISEPTASTPGRVLANYIPAIHGPLILNATAEPVDSVTHQYVDTIMLPATGGDQANTVEYKRKIWTCAAPYEMVADSQSGIYHCKFIVANHRCSDENDTTVPSSPVADEVLPSSTSPGEKFRAVVNKKLACCMNGFRSTPTLVDTYEKFDCIDNSNSAHNSTFDELWSSSDGKDDGGRMNALMLRGSGGKLLTGFYSLKGERCNQFSEFAATESLKHYKVDPAVLSGQQDSVGPSPTPSSGSPLPITDDFSRETQPAVSQRSAYPQTSNDRRACPILVRAAMIVTCPPSLDLPAALSTAITSVVSASPGGSGASSGSGSGSGSGGSASSTTVTRCATAGSIQIHVRIEQIFEITGQVVQKTIDTVINANQSSTLDISKIILSKNGDQCPPGTSLRGGMCTY